MVVDADNGDVDSYFFWGQVALQERMTEIAGNETLKGILDSLAMRTMILRRTSIAQPGRLQASVADQLRIFDAIMNRDGEMAGILLNAIESSEWAKNQHAPG